MLVTISCIGGGGTPITWRARSGTVSGIWPWPYRQSDTSNEPRRLHRFQMHMWSDGCKMSAFLPFGLANAVAKLRRIARRRSPWQRSGKNRDRRICLSSVYLSNESMPPVAALPRFRSRSSEMIYAHDTDTVMAAVLLLSPASVGRRLLSPGPSQVSRGAAAHNRCNRWPILLMMTAH